MRSRKLSVYYVTNPKDFGFVDMDECGSAKIMKMIDIESILGILVDKEKECCEFMTCKSSES